VRTGFKAGDVAGVFGPIEVRAGKAKHEKVPLSEIITGLNERGFKPPISARAES